MKFPGGLKSVDDEARRSRCRKRWRARWTNCVWSIVRRRRINVRMKGDHEIIALKWIGNRQDNDIEMLQDMIVAAVNEANRKVNEAMKSKLGSMLPPGLGNLF